MSFSMSYVDANYPSVAAEFTSTSITNMTDFGLYVDAAISNTWKLTWKLAFSYSNETSAPKFSVNIATGGLSGLGTFDQLYVDFDYGPGWIGNYSTEEAGWIGPNTSPDYPSAADVFHIVSLDLLVTGYTSGSTTVYPTVVVAASGDICRILQGHGTVTSF